MPPIPDRKAELTRTATLVREALLHARLHHRDTLPAALQQFPSGAGSAAATLLAWTLRAQDRPAELVTVKALDTRTGAPFTHTWVHSAPFHLDITGDQFTPDGRGTRRQPGLPGVYVARLPPPWTQGFLPDTTPDAPDADSGLQRTLDRITAWLPAIPALRFQARRKVVDYWQGADVLECGHVRHNPNRNAFQPRARPCHFCAAQAASRTYRATGETAALDWFARLSDEERGALIEQLYQVDAELKSPDPRDRSRLGHDEEKRDHVSEGRLESQ